MSTIVKFVSANYIKENTIIEMNVDESKITPIIIKVQSLYLKQILGSSFYDHMNDATAVYLGYETGTTLTTAELNLLRDYIKPYVAEYVVYEALPFLNFKATDKGISKESSEFSQPADLSEIKYLRSDVKDMAEFLGKRLAKYLCDHQQDFPEWQNPEHPENLPKNSKTYFNGIHLPRKKGVSGLKTWDEPYNEL